MKKRSVTVIVFNYNGKDLIRECLDSVLSQTYKNFDVIFFDDGSTDGSVEFVKRNYPEIKIVHVYPNSGIAKAQQTAFSMAKGDYIASLHVDAVADKNWLKELVAVMEKSGKKVACAQSTVYQKTGILDGSTNILSSNVVNLYVNEKEKFYAGTAAMILRNGITNVYCDPEYFFYLEDMYLGWILRLMGYKTVRAFKSEVKHRGTYTAKSLTIKKKYQFLYERNRLLNILTFFQIGTIIKILPLLLFHMALKLVNNIIRESWKAEAQLRSYFWFLLNLEKIFDKRRRIQKLRRVDDNEITKHMTCKIMAEKGKISKFLNGVSEVYCRIVGLKTLETI